MANEVSVVWLLASTFTTCVLRLSVLFMVSSQWQVRGFGEFSYESDDYTMAHVNITYLDPKTSKLYTEKEEVGKFSVGKIESVQGVVVHISSGNHSDNYGCAQLDTENVPQNDSWIALVKKGRCSVDKKISNVLKLNASALVIYNNDPGSKLIKMHHSKRDVVSVFVTLEKGEDIATLVENGTKVMMYITVGTHTTYRYANINRTSVLFVSISFIVLMIISLAWLVFYYIQRFRYIHAKDILARKLCNAAKKALAKIPVKTLKTGDKETESDFECCAVCIERYKISEVVRTLPCKHTFHKTCVDPWLLDQRTCPMCKMDILKFYGLLLSSSQDSIINIEIDGTIHQFPTFGRRHRSDSIDDDIMFNNIRRSSNRSSDFVLLEVSNLADLGSSAGPAARSLDRHPRLSAEECKTLLDADVQSDNDDNSVLDAPLQQSQPSFEHDRTRPPVESTSRDLLVILNSPSSDAGFNNMIA